MDNTPPQDNMPPFGRKALLERLDSLGINQITVDHPPIFTVAEGADIKAAMTGGHTKNLFF